MCSETGPEAPSLQLVVHINLRLKLRCHCLPGTFFGIFSKDADLIASGETALRIMVLATHIIGINVISTTVFQAIGKARSSFILSMCRQILFLIPLVLLLSRYFDISGVWLAFPLSDLMAGLLNMFLIVKEYRYFQGRPDPVPS